MTLPMRGLAKIKFYITGSDFLILHYKQPVLVHIKRYMVVYSLINKNSLKLVQTGRLLYSDSQQRTLVPVFVVSGLCFLYSIIKRGC